MMMGKLESYFWWKARMGKMQRNLRKSNGGGGGGGSNAGGNNATKGSNGAKSTTATGSGGQNGNTGYESAALKRKTEWQRGQAPSNKRRRTRGRGSISVGGVATSRPSATGANVEALEKESGEVADM
jgi:DNA excision repair protein ERCC-4